MLRVGYDTTAMYLNRAGEARYAQDLLAELRGAPGLDLRVLAPTRRLPRTLLQRIALQAAVQGVLQPWEVPRWTRREAIDVLHFTRPLVAPVPGLKVPTVVTVHDVLAKRAPQYFSRLIRTNFRATAERTIRSASAILTGSEYSRGEIVELMGVEPERVSVVPLGLNARFRPAPLEPATLAERFGITRPYVLCVGTLEIRKNLAGALRAFGRLADRGIDHQLVVAGGSGWMNSDFAALLEPMRDRVVVTGYVGDDDLVGLLSSASCFLYPSFLEGFGLPPLEAMACGAPVVSSGGGSLTEVCGDAALLVDPHDDEAIAAALERVLGDSALAAELRRRGLARAGEFTWARCAAGTARVYRAAGGS